MLSYMRYRRQLDKVYTVVVDLYITLHIQITGKKLEVDLTHDGLLQLQDLGLNCLPLLPQWRVTAFATT